jgi:predicted NUDIX family phosphoesterase
MDKRAFVPAADIRRLAKDVQGTRTWMKRESAERSRTKMQLIPCALVRRDDLYLALRRTRQTRDDLRSRVSLLSGGHIDFDPEPRSLQDLLERTLRRELAEELGVRSIEEMWPIGAVVDHSSLKASRHVAFVFEVVIADAVEAQAGEEFSLTSSFSGTFLSWPRLLNFEPRFDPWSRIISQEYFGREMKSLLGLDEARSRQLSLQLGV